MREFNRVCPICQNNFLTKKRNTIYCSRFCARQIRVVPTAERFWSKVDRSGGPDACWLWQASLNKRGYGIFNMGGRSKMAHRISYELAYGPITSGLSVLHSCPDGRDNPKCVNYSHLRLGTQQENMSDMVSRNRQCKGENRPQAKLTFAKVSEIRELFATGSFTKRQLGAMFDCSSPHIGSIISGKKWKFNQRLD